MLTIILLSSLWYLTLEERYHPDLHNLNNGMFLVGEPKDNECNAKVHEEALPLLIEMGILKWPEACRKLRNDVKQ